ncbi:MAG: NADH-quinone oxidoreductase subunit L [Rhodospirillales bacterium]|nr:NADH-quinone oxidoreductase subunit L [Alphaproteobacteria bacterium]MCB9980853.1 NADH-quinone oxidoreductase subunit L [Rhodospirillales bacterium]
MELLAVFLPLIAFLIAGVFGGRIGDRGCQFVTCTAVIVAALLAVRLFFDVAIGGNAYTTELSSWIVSGDLNISWALRIDSLSVVMMCVINIVSACVHVYSVGYMSHDSCKGRFMAYLSLFTFAMLMLVSADNLVQLFFGWEGVGLASYLLIGFWNHKNSANAAAVKAFVVNRVGDFGLALGMMAIFVVFGTLQFDAIFEQVPEMAGTYFTFIGQEYHALTLIGLLLFVGAIGKSAQLGLHTWLPDAMEGPTPVSALIHAATMVTAGVFLVARMSPLYEYAPDALMVVTLVGGATAFVAATIGLTQFDIKRVIAYSTMSQLGYMFFALGVSAYPAAMFHLMTHAFFKALLFLGAGSVIHAMSDEQDMRKMGGIWKKIPMTYGLMWVGSLALAGIPPFAGFYSKDIVLEAAWADQTWFGHIAFWLGIAAAFMTAFYTWRLLIMTFHGTPRASEKVMSHVHESPAVMLGPLVILATGALLAGMVFYEPFVGSGAKHPEIAEVEIVHHEIDIEVEHDVEGIVLEDEKEIAHGVGREKFWNGAIEVRHQNDTLEAVHHVPEWVKFLPLIMGLLGIGLAYLAYLLRPGIPEKIKTIFAAPYVLFFNKWFFDEIYTAVFVKTALQLGRFFWRIGDQNTIDRLGPDGSAKSVQKLAGAFSRFQSGYVFQYAFVMIIALTAIVSWFVFKSGQGF